mgnify:CR=1 FL=1
MAAVYRRVHPGATAGRDIVITNRDLDVIGLRDVAGLAAPARTTSSDDISYELLREVPPSRDGWSLLCRRGGRLS